MKNLNKKIDNNNNNKKKKNYSITTISNWRH